MINFQGSSIAWAVYGMLTLNSVEFPPDCATPVALVLLYLLFCITGKC